MTLRLVSVAALLSVACAGHTVKLPSRGVDVDVRVHVGSAALQGGTQTSAEPPRCACATGEARCCTCRKP